MLILLFNINFVDKSDKITNINKNKNNIRN